MKVPSDRTDKAVVSQVAVGQFVAWTRNICISYVAW